ncbi:hypothetical protein S7711_03652, partial [Stachybotrys chartarum IBT 7711]
LSRKLLLRPTLYTPALHQRNILNHFLAGHDRMFSSSQYRLSPAMALFLISSFVALSVLVLYRVYFHPLSHVPGPLIAKVSSLPLHVVCYFGIEAKLLRHLHQSTGSKIIRVAPNSVSLSDYQSCRDIYIAGGGFPKDDRYKNLDMGPIPSIFSARDKAYRDLRAKAVAPLFAPIQIRSELGPDGAIGSCVAEFADQLSKLSKSRVKTDLLDLCARLSIDVITGYLLGQRYGGLSEHLHLPLNERQSEEAKLSANHWVHAVVSWARFSLLPNRIFRIVFPIYHWLKSSDKLSHSITKINDYAQQIMVQASKSKTTPPYYYHEALLRAGVSPSEAAAQSQAIIFAGADSTAMMLVTTLFHLIQNGAARARLQCEIRDSARADGDMPFLRAVLKEGLRLGMANPTRLTRVIPSNSELRVGDDIFLPPGTVVGCAAYNLHHNPEVFPHPFSFRPERWMEDGTDCALRRPGMQQSLMPFGLGSRACIGKTLAMVEIQEAVVALVGKGILDNARHRLEIAWE